MSTNRFCQVSSPLFLLVYWTKICRKCNISLETEWATEGLRKLLRHHRGHFSENHHRHQKVRPDSGDDCCCASRSVFRAEICRALHADGSTIYYNVFGP